MPKVNKSHFEVCVSDIGTESKTVILTSFQQKFKYTYLQRHVYCIHVSDKHIYKRITRKHDTKFLDLKMLYCLIKK